jgi:hypothetical protein
MPSSQDERVVALANDLLRHFNVLLGGADSPIGRFSVKPAA